ncbi:chitin-binding protein [Streptomyces mashuensis]|uniref:Chitin-binding protein n=1 Tax=Streptomyces mashuensis TaxID=33904 RepID=A0A919AVN7_9ACTN|nr:lytic polysaccharide monooxygenase [Streptomyces mashuensis]GHF28481.1 chitin-binding protein [Streptomyces mashuensis]
MRTHHRAVVVTSLFGAAPLALVTLAAGPAAAHGSLTDPVSRVSACFAEGPEHPRSAACKAMVAAGGTQPLYDWNEVNIGDAAGRHRSIIPDGRLCSAGRDKYRGLDLPRADWPASKLAPGPHTFRYRATAPHRGTFELYVTKDGYDPKKPLKWSDLEAKPFAKVTNPLLQNGSYVFRGTVPKKSGRHLVYSIWQRSDSPEAFYTCSDVDFGGSRGVAAAAAPSDDQIDREAARSTVSHAGHGGDAHGPAAQGGTGHAVPAAAAGATTVQAPAAPGQGGNLAETGGDGTSTQLALAGAATLAAGATTLLLVTRRRAARNRA